jgi:hypothetical protein
VWCHASANEAGTTPAGPTGYPVTGLAHDPTLRYAATVPHHECVGPRSYPPLPTDAHDLGDLSIDDRALLSTPRKN